MNIYDTEFFKNWQNQGNTNEGITSQGIPDFQNYYNMNLGNQPFPHTGMQLPDVQPPGIEQSNVAQPQKKGFNFPGIFSLMQNMFQGAGDKLGMTQVTDADRAANKEFMQQTGIGINPQTGRMYGGNWNEASQDFAGKNAPGTSAWGSANFGEMAQKWDEKYGEMEYKTQKMKDKQARIKAQAIAYAQKLKADKIAADAAKTAPASSGFNPQFDRGAPGSQPSWHGATASRQAAGKSVAGPGFGRGAYWSQGGRVGYNRGGRVGILAAF